MTRAESRDRIRVWDDDAPPFSRGRLQRPTQVLPRRDAPHPSSLQPEASIVGICDADVPKNALTPCDLCTELFWSYSRRVHIGGRIHIATRCYRLRTCFAGLGVYQHTHSLTLLPGEQVDIEIVRRIEYQQIEKSFREVVSKNSARVSRKYKIAIDTKAEVEITFRSVRRSAIRIHASR